MRVAAGLRQEELADKAGISVRTLQAYEEGLRSINKMNLETAYKLTQALNVSMEELVEAEKITAKKHARKRTEKTP